MTMTPLTEADLDLITIALLHCGSELSAHDDFAADLGAEMEAVAYSIMGSRGKAREDYEPILDKLPEP